jgi:catechol 2,3-dioxygenase-like lactoylglutathione lyase family enzyme
MESDTKLWKNLNQEDQLPEVSALKRIILISIFGFFSTTALAQLPDFYRSVYSLHWVVEDLDAVVDGWTELGFPPAKYLGEGVLRQVEYRGQPTEIPAKLASVVIGGYRIVWIQPMGGVNAYTGYLKKRREGVISLNHKVASLEAMDREIERLSRLGVKLLQKGRFVTSNGVLTFVYMDTAEEGKYVLGLVHDSGEPDQFPQQLPINLRKSQYAFVVRNLEQVSDYWEKLGFPKFQVTHGLLTDLEHRGEPGHFDQKLGWQRHGDIVYEWILPLKGPTVYNESLAVHGEGFHHMAFDVDDMDKVLDYFASHGIPCSQSGAWGEKGKPGSGRFAYVDTEPLGGVTVELLWNYQD